jgi:hypothetical protein
MKRRFAADDIAVLARQSTRSPHFEIPEYLLGAEVRILGWEAEYNLYKAQVGPTGLIFLLSDEMLEEKANSDETIVWCPFCKKEHAGGATCMGHHP